MNFTAMIPARYGASRFPGKLLKDLGGQPVIVRTYNAVCSTELFDQVFVITDSPLIGDVIQKQGGSVLYSQKEHNSGSDRIAEACEKINTNIVINIQGDEPFTDKASLSSLIDVFRNDTCGKIDVATLMEKITQPEEIDNPNNVKVVTDLNNNALYFSRSRIPFNRNASTAIYYKHIGIYAYRKQALLNFTKMNPSVLEETEKLEQLRFLENGYRIRMVLTEHSTIGIDTPEDLEKARLLWNKHAK